ncbi:MAG: hypothetical protein H7Z13_06160 [Ferruginibacter sp.]|nr:hypothetical protein [Ferruginibacter sp.]
MSYNGRVGANTWTNKEGEVKASLTFHVNTIKLHGKPNGGGIAPAPIVPMTTVSRGRRAWDEH